ncbi:hypothetical protein L226DRAFT_537561 [Lentinus tigrinus ALCF2SS1-7]|uniref:uncharacterized protein n=1 Tax=Lentinus tigrinus ALCF2SS1-7 TaxID=1328758 RepID=UPI001165E013|nr:hypothetical protein L226DRAFT_537561 [Lentinus tigrinus ALCF2SS1-7]
MAKAFTLRQSLPHEGKAIRNALYEGARVPDLAAKTAAYNQIQSLVPGGFPWYTKHRHQTWCSRQDVQRGISRGRRHVQSPDTYGMIENEMRVIPDPRLSDIARWAAHMEVSRARVFEIASFVAGLN